MISFWCDRCKKDFDDNFTLRSNRYAKWFETRHKKCREICIRYADFPQKDPYFYKSLKVKRQMLEFAKELIQPGDPRYRMYYKKQYDDMEKSTELYYNRQIKEKKEKDAYYDKFSYDINRREVIKKAIEAEEKISGKR